MDTNHAHPDTASTPDIVAVLVDLARLTQHILGGSTPDSYETSAQMLLLRLLSLCELQRGALLLSTQYHTESQRSFWSSLEERKTLRILARHQINDEDLPPLLKTFSNHQDEDGQMVLFNAGWIICQHAISVPGSTHHHSSIEPLKAPFSSTLRFFVLGETEQQARSRQATLEQGKAVWPLVADAVGTVIVSLLQVEHLHDLETEVHHRDLQQMELLKAELLAAVSHELRSPLTSVKGYAATLLRHERRISREERHEFLLAIHDASQRLEGVTDRLLKMSQLETASVPLQRSPVDLVYIVREAISVKEQMQGEDSAPNIELSLHDQGVPQTKCTFVVHIKDAHGYPTHNVPLVYADRRLLREVLDHLLENAMQYSPEGGTVEIGLRTRGPEQMYLLAQEFAHSSGVHRSPIVFPPSWTPDQPSVELWVRDHGIGIAEAHLEQIFQRFYRVDTSLTRAVNGLGLGLTICQQIIALHDGLLWVESEEGKGSIFHVLLPIDEQALS
jgi:signal transduction histidine kinase